MIGGVELLTRSVVNNWTSWSFYWSKNVTIEDIKTDRQKTRPVYWNKNVTRKKEEALQKPELKLKLQKFQCEVFNSRVLRIIKEKKKERKKERKKQRKKERNKERKKE